MRLEILYSVAFCIVAAGLEGYCAGGSIRQRLVDLRQPRFVPPFWGWIVIGALYYVICFAVLYRLFLLPRSSGRMAAFALIGTFMFINALWNYFFFRTRNLWHAFVLGIAYNVIALALFSLLLIRVDRVAAWCLSPYLLYLFYANSWGYRTWKLNPPAQPN